MMDAVKKLEFERPPSCVIRFFPSGRCQTSSSTQGGPSVVENTQREIGSADGNNPCPGKFADLQCDGNFFSTVLFFFDKIEVNGEVDAFLSNEIGKRIFAFGNHRHRPYQSQQKNPSPMPTTPIGTRGSLNAKENPRGDHGLLDKLAEIRVHGGSNLTSAGLNSVFCSSTGSPFEHRLSNFATGIRVSSKASTDWSISGDGRFGPRNSTTRPPCIKANNASGPTGGWMPVPVPEI